jgi:NAD(P)-dependent dehydrogenase (short-subunit alcohol dehydrogenase family)
MRSPRSWKVPLSRSSHRTLKLDAKRKRGTEEQRTLTPRRKRASIVDHSTREQQRFASINRAAQEIGNAVAFLASDEASGNTDTALYVDGGASAAI